MRTKVLGNDTKEELLLQKRFVESIQDPHSTRGIVMFSDFLNLERIKYFTYDSEGNVFFPL